jgi:hypothetical protein
VRSGRAAVLPWPLPIEYQQVTIVFDGVPIETREHEVAAAVIEGARPAQKRADTSPPPQVCNS